MTTMMIRIRPSDMARSERTGSLRTTVRAPAQEGGKHIRRPRSMHRPLHPASGGVAVTFLPRRQPCASARLQLDRRRIDAIAQAGRARSVVENVAEMAAAFGAQHFGADHAVAQI